MLAIVIIYILIGIIVALFNDELGIIIRTDKDAPEVPAFIFKIAFWPLLILTTIISWIIKRLNQ